LVLRFSVAWRFNPPEDGRWYNKSIPDQARYEFCEFVTKLAAQGNRWDILEHFKGYFCRAVGVTHMSSSSESWAETDLDSYMWKAADNAPVFLDALFDACQALRKIDEQFQAPFESFINEICETNKIGYEIKPPDLVMREGPPSIVSVPERPPTLAEKALEILEISLQRSEQLLSEARGREAVQEILWILESVATAFRGIETSGSVVQGKYFNKIVRELRAVHTGTALDRILEWFSALHGFLSSPTGGGIRHGLDLTNPETITTNEARLYCNLIRSYLSYLLHEHERLGSKQLSG